MRLAICDNCAITDIGVKAMTYRDLFEKSLDLHAYLCNGTRVCDIYKETTCKLYIERK